MTSLLDSDRLWDNNAPRPWDDDVVRIMTTDDRLWAAGVGRLWDDDTPRQWPYYDAPTSIPADGSVDVTTSLQAWLNTLPDGATARLANGGLYRTEGPLLIKDRAGFTLDGNGATLQAFTDGSGISSPDVYFNPNWPRKRTRVTVLRGSGVTVKNLVLRGGHPSAGAISGAYVADLEAQMGVEFVDTTAGLVTDCEVYDVYGDFVYVQNSTNVTAQNVYARRNGRQGMSVVRGSNVWLVDNDLAETGRAMFDIEANVDADVIDNVHIERNTCGQSRLLWLANGGQSWHISNIYIRDNVMTALSGVPVIQVTNGETDGKRGPYFIEGNTFHVAGSPAPGFRFDNVTGVSFTDNTATFDPTRSMIAVRLTDSDASLARNTFTGQAVDVQTVAT